MNELEQIFEEVLIENTQDVYRETVKEYEQIAELFDQYFISFEPEQDILITESKNHLFEINTPEQNTNRDTLLTTISSRVSNITRRIQNLYSNDFIHHSIIKNDADRITRRIILRLRELTTDYLLYLRYNNDENIDEAKNLFEGYVKQSKILDDLLRIRNEQTQSGDQQLERIYLNGKLNINILPSFEKVLRKTTKLYPQV